jgi:ribosomal protein L11 methyltransferase
LNTSAIHALTLEDGDFCTANGCPYKDLHIYYLKGRLKSSEAPDSEAFLGNWEEDGYSFLFFSAPCDHAVDRLLAMNGELSYIDRYRMTYEEWHGGPIRPMSIGSFEIVPPWDNVRGSEAFYTQHHRIVLDPGLVFGTGLHPTTHDCLEALGKVCYANNIASVIDIGTGTGLLAIAAAKIGCESVLAVDLNFLAARTALNNIRLNGMENIIMAIQGQAAHFIEKPFDLLIANIHFDVMKDLILSEGFLKKKWFILSGLLRSQARELENRFFSLPVEIVSKWVEQGIWHTYLGKVNPMGGQSREIHAIG